jgi:hypothetical protein
MSNDKPSRNEDEYFVKQDAELMKAQRARIEAERADAERRLHFMKCPKDGHDVVTTTHHGVQVENCPHCHGIWLDAGELDQVAHDERPGVLGRVVGDLFTSLRGPGRSKSST